MSENTTHLLSVKDLHTSFTTDHGDVQAVNGVSFNLDAGKVLGIVGESGSGKSVTAYSIMQILADNGRITSGEILYKGEDISRWSESRMQDFRGKCCSIIFQDPMTSLNPVFTIGSQIAEAVLLHTKSSKREAMEKALEMLKLVGINEPEKRLKQYPYELSGGMRQRVMIAMALACEPDILIADEPTTALDVTIQAQILELMAQLKQQMNTAILLITHDMGVVAEMSDQVLVMYAGHLMEYASATDLFQNPLHPYTQGLLASIPRLDQEVEHLHTIKGNVPNLYDMPRGCRFCTRCPHAEERCFLKEPGVYLHGNSQVKCFLYER